MKKAFTLAEVLITLGIVGVIAALTLPSLTQNAQKSSMEKAITKFYNQFQSAVLAYKAEQGTDIVEDLDDNFVTKNFDIAKKCDITNNGKCFAENYNYYKYDGLSKLDLRILDIVGDAENSYLLKDGTAFVIAKTNGTQQQLVIFDINGPEKPNQMGKDLWTFFVYKNGSIDDKDLSPNAKKTLSAAELETIITSSTEHCKDGGYTGCFAQFMRNNFKFDY